LPAASRPSKITTSRCPVETIVLQLDQFPLQAEQFAEILLARLAMLGAKAHRAVDDAIIDFHFEFFVVGVDEVFLETALPLRHQFGMRFWVRLFHCGSPRNRNGMARGG
jgi:hypothetical protein